MLRVTDLENVMLCVQILLVNPERKKTVSVFLRTDFMENEWGVDLLLMTGSLNLQCYWWLIPLLNIIRYVFSIVKHLRWSFLRKLLKPLTSFTKISILNVWLGCETLLIIIHVYPSAYCSCKTGCSHYPGIFYRLLTSTAGY